MVIMASNSILSSAVLVDGDVESDSVFQDKKPRIIVIDGIQSIWSSYVNVCSYYSVKVESHQIFHYLCLFSISELHLRKG